MSIVSPGLIGRGRDVGAMDTAKWKPVSRRWGETGVLDLASPCVECAESMPARSLDIAITGSSHQTWDVGFGCRHADAVQVS